MTPSSLFGRRPPGLPIAAAVGLLLLCGVVALRDGGPTRAWTVHLPAKMPYAAACDGHRLAFCTADETLRVVDTATGEPLWSWSDLRAYATPVLADGRLYVRTIDREVVALDAATGEELWAFDADGFVSAMVATGGELVLGRGAGFEVLDAASGRYLWGYRASADSEDVEITEAVAVEGDVAFVAYSVKSDFELSFADRRVVDGGVYAVDLDSGQRRWTAPIDDRVDHTPVVAGDLVVVATHSGIGNSVYALDRADGAVRWKEVGVEGAPAVVGDVVCFEGVDSRTTRSGPVPILEESHSRAGLALATGAERWRRRASHETFGAWAWEGLALFVRGPRVEAFHPDGDRAWSVAVGAAVSGRPRIDGGRLVVFTEDARLLAFDLGARP